MFSTGVLSLRHKWQICVSLRPPRVISKAYRHWAGYLSLFLKRGYLGLFLTIATVKESGWGLRSMSDEWVVIRLTGARAGVWSQAAAGTKQERQVLGSPVMWGAEGRPGSDPDGG